MAAGDKAEACWGSCKDRLKGSSAVMRRLVSESQLTLHVLRPGCSV